MAGVGTIYEASSLDGALRQGEILAGLIQTLRALQGEEPEGTVEVEFKEHPLAIILSQDCDLDQDYRSRQPGAEKDRTVPSVLFCEVTDAYTLRNRPVEGIGADALSKTPGKEFNAEMWKRIKQNKDERYHFLQKIEVAEDGRGEGLPELGIDFKRYFTMPTSEVYDQIRTQVARRCRLCSPYLEHLSTRFCYYQFRVALPEDHFSE